MKARTRARRKKENRSLAPPLPKVVAVMSGKGGVGKTTVTVGTAMALARRGYRVGVADCDFESPTLAVIGGAPDVAIGDGYLLPREVHGVRMVSIGSMIDPDSPVMLTHEQKAEMVAQFFRSVAWGELDFLVVDLPPNASSEVWALMTLRGPEGERFFAERMLGAIVVTEPSEPSIASGRRTISLARMVGLPVLGIVENKAGEVFGHGGGERLAALTGVPFLTSIPLDPSIRVAGDEGREMPDGPFAPIAEAILRAAGVET